MRSPMAIAAPPGMRPAYIIKFTKSRTPRSCRTTPSCSRSGRSTTIARTRSITACISSATARWRTTRSRVRKPRGWATWRSRSITTRGRSSARPSWKTSARTISSWPTSPARRMRSGTATRSTTPVCRTSATAPSRTASTSRACSSMTTLPPSATMRFMRTSTSRPSTCRAILSSSISTPSTAATRSPLCARAPAAACAASRTMRSTAAPCSPSCACRTA